MTTRDPNASECKSWLSAADLVGNHPDAAIALIGAPLGERSLTPGRCDLAPTMVRRALLRMSTYDVETGADLSAMRVHDAGDLALKIVPPSEAFEPIRNAVAAEVRRRRLTIVLGGNNAVTRPGVHGLGPLDQVGVLMLDAHFDLRDTDCGLNNGNPIKALLEDGLDGKRISQIGLAPFANTKRAHQTAKDAGISVRTTREFRDKGTARIVAQELDRLSKLAARIYVDFDIDVIDRGQFPAAPGARPGGISVHDFFDAARVIGAHPKVAAVDLTEYDPACEVGDLGSLTAARWFVELLAGFQQRS